MFLWKLLDPFAPPPLISFRASCLREAVKRTNGACSAQMRSVWMRFRRFAKRKRKRKRENPKEERNGKRWRRSGAREGGKVETGKCISQKCCSSTKESHVTPLHKNKSDNKRESAALGRISSGFVIAEISGNAWHSRESSRKFAFYFRSVRSFGRKNRVI